MAFDEGLLVNTLIDILNKTARFLESKGVPSPRIDAECMLSELLGVPRFELYLDAEQLLSDSQLDRLREWVRRRGTREPLQYILGKVDFFGMTLKVDQRALIPRPETEQMLEHVIRACKAPHSFYAQFRPHDELHYERVNGSEAADASSINAQNPPQDAALSPKPIRKILDVGTGSGALALGLAKAFPEAEVWAVDQSEDCLALAKENAQALGLSDRVHILKSNWLSALKHEDGSDREDFDLIVSNPPYLSEEEWACSQDEVRLYEPKSALVAEQDGIADLLLLLWVTPRRIRSGGLIALETGIDHKQALDSIGQNDPRWEHALCLKDFSNHWRYFIAWRSHLH